MELGRKARGIVPSTVKFSHFIFSMGRRKVNWNRQCYFGWAPGRFYSHLLVHPDYQGRGIGKMIVEKMQETYGHFHMQMLTADGKAIDFYKKLGFVRAGHTESMWIYKGDEH